MKKYTKQILTAASKIKLIATDIDGVMTAGEIILLENGEEIKIWNVKDRLGMHLLKEYLPNVKVAWITGRKSKQVEIRAKEQKVDFLVQECKDKLKSLNAIANKMSIGISEIAYIGDDRFVCVEKSRIICLSERCGHRGKKSFKTYFAV